MNFRFLTADENRLTQINADVMLGISSFARGLVKFLILGQKMRLITNEIGVENFASAGH
jgi:hypothetical protein